MGVGLVKVYKSLIKLPSGVLPLGLLMSMSDTSSVIFQCNITIAAQKI